MRETPLDGVLNPDEAKQHAAEHFDAQIDLLQDLAAYGSNLIVRAHGSSGKSLSDTVICGVFLKQIVAMVDASAILLEAGSVHAAHLPTRSAFEALMYLQWLLLADSERRATYYVVSNYRDERLSNLRVIKGTPESIAFDAVVKDTGLDIHATRPGIGTASQERLDELNGVLSQPAFKGIDAEFEAARKGRRKFDPHWYEMLGIKSLRDLANAVGLLAEYEFAYDKGSQIHHTATYGDHIRFTKGQVQFLPIRHLSEVGSLVKFLVGTTLRAYRQVLTKYRPGELPAFTQKYREEWREPFLNIKEAKYDWQ